MPGFDAPAPDDHPSLVENVARHPPRIRASLILAGALAVLGLGLTMTARGVRRQSETLRLESASAVAQQRTAEVQAESDGAVPLSATLDAFAQHLPATVSLVSAEGRPGGGVRIAIDAPDPDLLRQSLAGDPWFDRFRERGQDQHDDGSFRVTLESR